MRKIEWKHSAVKDLRGIASGSVASILEAIRDLADDPKPHGCRKLHGSEHTYRIRIGDYRVIYSIENSALTIWIVRIGHRKEVYRRP